MERILKFWSTTCICVLDGTWCMLRLVPKASFDNLKFASKDIKWNSLTHFGNLIYVILKNSKDVWYFSNSDLGKQPAPPPNIYPSLDDLRGPDPWAPGGAFYLNKKKPRGRDYSQSGHRTKGRAVHQKYIPKFKRKVQNNKEPRNRKGRQKQDVRRVWWSIKHSHVPKQLESWCLLIDIWEIATVWFCLFHLENRFSKLGISDVGFRYILDHCFLLLLLGLAFFFGLKYFSPFTYLMVTALISNF